MNKLNQFFISVAVNYVNQGNKKTKNNGTRTLLPDSKTFNITISSYVFKREPISEKHCYLHAFFKDITIA